MDTRPRFVDRRRFAVAGGLALVTTFLLAVAPAGAATTIGSDLAAAPDVALNCGGCTVSQRSLPGRQVTAPIDGVIVRWRIRVGAFSTPQPARLRVIRGSGAASTAVGSSQNENLPLGGTYAFNTRLPIHAGDFIGIDCCAAPGNYFRNVAGASRDTWGAPYLADGETRAPSSAPVLEAMINADIEPDADGDGFGDETQDNCVGQSGTQNGCPVPVAPDTQRPDTTITQTPSYKTKEKQARFEFTSTEPGASFTCSLDGAAFSACTSPLSLPVSKGTHSFSVLATDTAGNTDASPASYDWTVVKKKKKKKT